MNKFRRAVYQVQVNSACEESPSWEAVRGKVWARVWGKVWKGGPLVFKSSGEAERAVPLLANQLQKSSDQFRVVEVIRDIPRLTPDQLREVRAELQRLGVIGKYASVYNNLHPLRRTYKFSWARTEDLRPHQFAEITNHITNMVRAWGYPAVESYLGTPPGGIGRSFFLYLHVDPNTRTF